MLREACRRRMKACWPRAMACHTPREACLMMPACHRHLASCHRHWASCHRRRSWVFCPCPCPLTSTCPSCQVDHWTSRTDFLVIPCQEMSSGTCSSSYLPLPFCPQAWYSWHCPHPCLSPLHDLHAPPARLSLLGLHDHRNLRRVLRVCQSPGTPARPCPSAS